MLYIFGLMVNTGDGIDNAQTSIKTEAGNLVNRVDKGLYEVAATGEKLSSDDPSAP